MWLSRADQGRGPRDRRRCSSPTRTGCEKLRGLRPRRRVLLGHDRHAPLPRRRQPQGQGGAAERVLDLRRAARDVLARDDSRPRASTRSAAARASSRMVELLDRLAAGEDYLRRPELLVQAPRDGRDRQEPPAPAGAGPRRAGLPRPRGRSTTPGAIYRDTDRKVFVTQRGCPMPCSFCFHHAWKKKVYNVKNSEYVRKRSVSHLIDEIKEVRATLQPEVRPLRRRHLQPAQRLAGGVLPSATRRRSGCRST